MPGRKANPKKRKGKRQRKQAANAGVGAGGAVVAAGESKWKPEHRLEKSKGRVAGMDRRLQALKAKYSMLGKEEWWWIFDDTLARVGELLRRDHFCILDGFLPMDQARALRAEIRSQYDAGRMEPGVLGGGRSGTSTAYVLKEVRGDNVGWFSGLEEGYGWNVMPQYKKKIGTLATELATYVPELKVIDSSCNMMCTCYPGAGARYTLHIDNARKNGRKLTALCYLNCEWKPGDGGELRVFKPDRKTIVTDVQPLGGRVLIFFSDQRVPHEVLPAAVARYAATIWFFDGAERRRALEAEAHQSEEAKRQEQQRIRKEIMKFEGQVGTKASAFDNPERVTIGPVPPPRKELDPAVVGARAGVLPIVPALPDTDTPASSAPSLPPVSAPVPAPAPAPASRLETAVAADDVADRVVLADSAAARLTAQAESAQAVMDQLNEAMKGLDALMNNVDRLQSAAAATPTAAATAAQAALGEAQAAARAAISVTASAKVAEPATALGAPAPPPAPVALPSARAPAPHSPPVNAKSFLEGDDDTTAVSLQFAPGTFVDSDASDDSDDW